MTANPRSAAVPSAGDGNAEGSSGVGQAASAVRPRRPLADDVQERILADYLVGSEPLAVGERLPGEVELSRRYAVSRVTLRAALRSLQEAGFISIRHGSGATVLPRSDALLSGLDRLCSLETLAREAGGVAGSEDVEFEPGVADAEVAARLEVALGEAIVVVRRVKTYAGERVAYMVGSVPEAVCAIDRLRESFRGSVLDVLLDPGFGVDYADCEVTPVALDAEIAGRLQVPVGTVALHLAEVMRTREGVPLEWGESWLLPGFFHFTLRRRNLVRSGT